MITVFYFYAAVLSAQTYSGYFLDDYNYRFQMNPAFANNDNFVSMPGLGNLNANMHGNLHLKEIIYPLNGKTVLFTNPDIDVKRAMKGFGKNNRMGTNEKIDILAGGFYNWGGYNTVALSAVASADVAVPGSFFSLAKEGLTNDNYEIKDMVGNIHGYFQLAFNHSRVIWEVPGLRAGATFKILIGGGNFDFKFNDAYLTLDENKWNARTNAEVYASMGGFKYKYSHSDRTNRDIVSGGNCNGFKPQGFGLAIDLGAEYNWEDFTFSAAILDLGFINWGKTQKAHTQGTQNVTSDSFIFNVDNDKDNSFKREWRKLRSEIASLYQLTEVETLSSYTRALGATLNFGADYELPSYNRLHFGLVNSTKIYGKYTWTQFRLSANVKPVDYFSANLNFVADNYGVGLGWLLNVHTTGFNLFLGMDQIYGKMSKECIPLNSNAAFNLGINFPF